MICLLVFAVPAAVLSVPATPFVFELTQPNGATFDVRLKGDEWFNWHETIDRHVIVKNKNNGYYEYAVIKKKGMREILAPSGIIVKRSGALESLGVGQLPSISPQDLGRMWKAAIQRKRQ